MYTSSKRRHRDGTSFSQPRGVSLAAVGVLGDGKHYWGAGAESRLDPTGVDRKIGGCAASGLNLEQPAPRSESRF